MSSFTSSSKTGLIKGTLIVFFTLFIGYGIIAPRHFPNGGAPRNQWQGNIIKAQRYIYNDSDIPYVIIGSSLAARMSGELLPDKYYNLAFDGGNLFDGLEVIIKSNKRPKAVFVEMNVLTKKPNEKFINTLFTPVVYNLRSFLSPLREDYQPIAITFAAPLFNKLLNMAEFKNEVVKEDKKRAQEVFDVWLATSQNEYKKIPDLMSLEKKLETLSNKLHVLSSRGVKIVFFEMPMHHSLMNSNTANTIRARVIKKFPQNVYTWIPMPNLNYYETTDGMHLKRESAQRYTAYLTQWHATSGTEDMSEYR